MSNSRRSIIYLWSFTPMPPSSWLLPEHMYPWVKERPLLVSVKHFESIHFNNRFYFQVSAVLWDCKSKWKLNSWMKYKMFPLCFPSLECPGVSWALSARSESVLCSRTSSPGHSCLGSVRVPGKGPSHSRGWSGPRMEAVSEANLHTGQPARHVWNPSLQISPFE